MNIIGLGTQIHDCARVKKLIDKHGEKFLYEVFTEAEIKYCSKRTHSTEYYAAFWSTKEAVFRSLGTKWKRGMSWHDVQVICVKASTPRVTLTGRTREKAAAAGVKDIRVSFAYSRHFATATAIAVK
jgi:holo-[acyl-carrier protein] synthase